MIFGDFLDLTLPICLTGEEKPRKNLIQETCPDRASNRARCLTDAHATAFSTAVNNCNVMRRKFPKIVVVSLMVMERIEYC